MDCVSWIVYFVDHDSHNICKQKGKGFLEWTSLRAHEIIIVYDIMKDEKKTNQGSQMITILIIMALVMAMGYAYFKFTGTLL